MEANKAQIDNLVSLLDGYAVNFIKLTPQQQADVISRTFHEAL